MGVAGRVAAVENEQDFVRVLYIVLVLPCHSVVDRVAKLIGLGWADQWVDVLLLRFAQAHVVRRDAVLDGVHPFIGPRESAFAVVLDHRRGVESPEILLAGALILSE